MEKSDDPGVTELNLQDLEGINGGFIPAVVGAYYATQYLVAAYGATKVATAVGAAAGAATYVYVKS